MTYAELDRLVSQVAASLGVSRRVAVIEMSPTVEAVAAYLGALRAGQPGLLVAEGEGPKWADRYGRVHLLAAGSGWEPREAGSGQDPDLHPDLALLMTTSGSTGSPKVVRLSRQNLTSNTEVIAGYLNLTPDDVAVTTLPLHYCYGLSVLNAQLQAGGSTLLAEMSVVDPCFWAAADEAGVTTIAGVPHTFEMLERSGFDPGRLPSLRRFTQAGGRLRPELVEKYARMGADHGWEFVVMYGQTEATARMAYLPSHLAAAHPDSVGRAIPGGTLALDPATVDESGAGELIYRGPNVMMGYATEPTDLALGPTVEELRTGDLARIDGDGLIRIVGRASRIVKPLGVRVDLDELENLLARQGLSAWCAGDDNLIAVGVEGDVPSEFGSLLAARLDVPRDVVRVVDRSPLAPLPSGKPDLDGLLDLAQAERRGNEGASTVRSLFSELLGCEPGPDDTFVGSGGDSLTYVEMSVGLEEIVGSLPRDWHVTPVAQLEALGRSRPGRRVEFGVLARALAITLIVGTHVGMWSLAGGAHLLLAVAGLNFARFQRRGGNRLLSFARIAVPSVAWIGTVAAVSGRIDWAQAAMVKSFVISPGQRWEYWFIEAILYLLAGAGLLLAFGPTRRLERRQPGLFATALLVAALVLRFDLLGLAAGHHRLGRAQEVAWLFAFGWAAAVASTRVHRLGLSAVALAAVPGFFGAAQRDAIVLAGLLGIVWVSAVRVPRLSVSAISAVAGASLFIYLVHWQVYPPIVRTLGPAPALVASLAAGIAAWIVWGRIQPYLAALVPRRAEAGG